MVENAENESCPVCGQSKTHSVINRENLVTMQNYIYKDYLSAQRAPVGKFQLRVCNNCGFVYNASFDPTLMTYDPNYDNQVPSKLFHEYYASIARFLYENYDLENKLVIEIGCGKGTFLETLCGLYPSIRGLGVDPSYDPVSRRESPGNLSFFQDVFKPELLSEQPALIICRHVLEHIYDPISFLRSVRKTLLEYPETSFFMEVPDLEWILENGAFWDFCYEHCNYFTIDTLENILMQAGFNPQESRRTFGGQYLWMRGVTQPVSRSAPQSRTLSNKLAEYASTENYLMKRIGSILRESKAEGSVIIVWGMATKGVLFCNLVDPHLDLVDYCIDINPKKQNCFVPRTTHLISSPDVLAEARSAPATVVVMNPNYLSEIREYIAGVDLNPKFIDAGGKAL